MNQPLRRVAVLGAGTMGSQIAAHLANVDIPVLLLDLPSPGPDRSAVARRALENLGKIQPPPLFRAEKARRITPGNFEDDLPRLGECDWILEAVVERLDVKRSLWEQVEGYRKPGSIVSTNTSGLPIHQIGQGRSEDFLQHWLGTHFFNPPRYMRLLELIPGPHTRPEVLQTVAFVGERLLGKGIVYAKDTPNFIGNRIGSFVAMRAMQLAEELGLRIEEVDALTGPLIGLPKTATFRLADLVGIDVLALVAQNLYRNLPGDPWRDSFRPPALVQELVSRKWLGRKTGQGFYKKEGSAILVLDPKTVDYRPPVEVNFPELEAVGREPDTARRLGKLLEGEGMAAKFLWPLFRDTWVYSAERVGEICEEYFQIDRAKRWGFNWEQGPFELWEGIGIEAVASRIEEEGKSLPDWVQELRRQGRGFYPLGLNERLYFDIQKQDYQVLPEPPEKIQLEILKMRERVVRSNEEASLIDLGDGVACLEFHSKANSLGPKIVEMAFLALEEVERRFLGLVIGNQGKHFSVGANLVNLVGALQQGRWKEIEESVKLFQQMTLRLRYSSRPVVAAPFQRTLGGGVEVCLGCDGIVASAETYMGLVEVGVGLIPAGGGCKEMLIRSLEGGGREEERLMAALRHAFETIGKAKVSGSGEEAREMKFLASQDSIEIHPDRLLHRAKEKVLSLLEEGYVQPLPDRQIPVTGAAGQALLKVGIHLLHRAGYLSEYDLFIGQKLAHVLSGGNLSHTTLVSEQYLLDLEREAFLSLCGQEKTQQRILHLLKTGKPLRN